ncbi:hypothetical protein ACQP2F_18630 [Actinoplanes sp. CA-030573]|uniref:hypothetical protein n=1 Tax=Actinoplanes sp. CA-030573 TaxID=3239898 RepID=UPI003D8A1A80
MSRTFARLLAVALGAAGTLFAVIQAGPAQAADTTTITAVADSGFAATAGEDRPRTITCIISTNAPYAAPDNHGYPIVVATGVTHCTSNVAEIAQTHDLFWGGTRKSERYLPSWDTHEVPTYPDAPCIAGPWLSSAEAWVYFPAGYYPPLGIIHISAQSSVTTDDCAAILNGGGGGGGGGGGSGGGGGGGGCVITCPLPPIDALVRN